MTSSSGSDHHAHHAHYNHLSNLLTTECFATISDLYASLVEKCEKVQGYSGTVMSTTAQVAHLLNKNGCSSSSSSEDDDDQCGGGGGLIQFPTWYHTQLSPLLAAYCNAWTGKSFDDAKWWWKAAQTYASMIEYTFAVDKCFDALNQAIRLAPFEQSHFLFDCFYQRSTLHYQNKSYEQSLVDVHYALQFRPHSFVALQRKLSLLKLLNRGAEAYRLVASLVKTMMKSKSKSKSKFENEDENDRAMMAMAFSEDKRNRLLQWKQELRQYKSYDESDDLKATSKTTTTSSKTSNFQLYIDSRIQLADATTSATLGGREQFQATESIPVGTELWKEEAAIFVLRASSTTDSTSCRIIDSNTDSMLRYCNVCRRECARTFWPCAGCNETIFCSLECAPKQQQINNNKNNKVFETDAAATTTHHDHDHHHPMECGLVSLIQRTIHPQAAQAYRLLSLATITSSSSPASSSLASLEELLHNLQPNDNDTESRNSSKLMEIFNKFKQKFSDSSSSVNATSSATTPTTTSNCSLDRITAQRWFLAAQHELRNQLVARSNQNNKRRHCTAQELAGAILLCGLYCYKQSIVFDDDNDDTTRSSSLSRSRSRSRNKKAMMKRIQSLVVIIVNELYKIGLNEYGWSDMINGRKMSIGNFQCLFGSRLGHWCEPNVEWNYDGHVFSVKSIRPIEAGDEIAITYGQLQHLPYFARLAHLRAFAYLCHCPRCLHESVNNFSLQCGHCGTGSVPYSSSTFDSNTHCMHCGSDNSDESLSPLIAQEMEHSLVVVCKSLTLISGGCGDGGGGSGVKSEQHRKYYLSQLERQLTVLCSYVHLHNRQLLCAIAQLCGEYLRTVNKDDNVDDETQQQDQQLYSIAIAWHQWLAKHNINLLNYGNGGSSGVGGESSDDHHHEFEQFHYFLRWIDAYIAMIDVKLSQISSTKTTTIINNDDDGTESIDMLSLEQDFITNLTSGRQILERLFALINGIKHRYVHNQLLVVANAAANTTTSITESSIQRQLIKQTITSMEQCLMGKAERFRDVCKQVQMAAPMGSSYQAAEFVDVVDAAAAASSATTTVDDGDEDIQIEPTADDEQRNGGGNSQVAMVEQDKDELSSLQQEASSLTTVAVNESNDNNEEVMMITEEEEDAVTAVDDDDDYDDGLTGQQLKGSESDENNTVVSDNVNVNPDNDEDDDVDDDDDDSEVLISTPLGGKLLQQQSCSSSSSSIEQQNRDQLLTNIAVAVQTDNDE